MITSSEFFGLSILTRHSASCVAQVLALAQTYAAAPNVEFDLGVNGRRGGLVGAGADRTPYVWGGETPCVGFECSGLVQAAYAVAGVSLPRVAQDQ